MDDTNLELQRPVRPPRRPMQFSLPMLFWTTFNVGMALAYLRSYGPAVLARGLLVIVGATLLGMAVGRPRAAVCGDRGRSVGAAVGSARLNETARRHGRGFPRPAWHCPMVGSSGRRFMPAAATRHRSDSLEGCARLSCSALFNPRRNQGPPMVGALPATIEVGSARPLSMLGSGAPRSVVVRPSDAAGMTAVIVRPCRSSCHGPTLEARLPPVCRGPARASETREHGTL